jgi:hypothetical protein
MNGFGFIDNDTMTYESAWAGHESSTATLPPGVVSSEEPNYWRVGGPEAGGGGPEPVTPTALQDRIYSGGNRVDHLDLDANGFVSNGTFDPGFSGQEYVTKKLEAKGFKKPCCGSCAGGGECEGGCGCGSCKNAAAPSSAAAPGGFSSTVAGPAGSSGAGGGSDSPGGVDPTISVTPDLFDPCLYHAVKHFWVDDAASAANGCNAGQIDRAAANLGEGMAPWRDLKCPCKSVLYVWCKVILDIAVHRGAAPPAGQPSDTLVVHCGPALIDGRRTDVGGLYQFPIPGGTGTLNLSGRAGFNPILRYHRGPARGQVVTHEIGHSLGLSLEWDRYDVARGGIPQRGYEGTIMADTSPGSKPSQEEICAVLLESGFCEPGDCCPFGLGDGVGDVVEDSDQWWMGASRPIRRPPDVGPGIVIGGWEWWMGPIGRPRDF